MAAWTCVFHTLKTVQAKGHPRNQTHAHGRQAEGGVVGCVVVGAPVTAMVSSKFVKSSPLMVYSPCLCFHVASAVGAVNNYGIASQKREVIKARRVHREVAGGESR